MDRERMRMIQAEAYLDEIPMWASEKNSLGDIRDFLGRMGHPDRGMKMIHVAGTNGKGSVCAYLTSILGKAGYHTASFISPHLISVKERFLHDGQIAEEKEFLEAFGKVKALSQVMAAEGYNPPTYFEFLFYMFMELSKMWNSDFVILETGLGGLLDTTNVVEHPLVTVITSISMDHMQYLGNTIEEIAGQKAGILKYRVPVVYDGCCEESRQVIEAAAETLSCLKYPFAWEDVEILGRDDRGARIALAAGEERLELLIPSKADYQMINAGLAVRAAEVIRRAGPCQIPGDAIVEGIKAGYWPGRMEEVLPGVFLDGAHNAGGMEALTKTIARMERESKEAVSLMFGVAEDKEYHKMIGELCSQVMVSHVTVARMRTGRSASAQVLAEEFRSRLSCSVEAFDTVEEAWECFLAHKGDGPAFCAGSLYLVGEVKALLL